MAIDFERSKSAAAPVAAPQVDTSIAEVQPYDIISDREQTVTRLAHSPEVEALTAQIDIDDLSTIVSFGSSAADEISKASDAVLRSMSLSQIDESGKMLEALNKIMGQFNVEEIRENPTLFGKLFGNLRKQLERILAKYSTMGDEVDKIYVSLRQYENEIKQSNTKLENLFQANVDSFHDLERYIVAGDQGCQEIQAYMDQLQEEQARTGDQAITFQLQSLQQALLMLEQRTQDLRTAESVALQSIPMLRTIQFSNMNLVRKINSAFIVTLPVFKQQLAQAILLKRQRLQADAISALDQRTNEMLLKNARNAAEQAKLTTRMAASTSIKAETLETTWRTIMGGIEETRKIQEEARAKRLDDQKRLEAIKQEFLAKYNMPKP